MNLFSMHRLFAVAAVTLFLSFHSLTVAQDHSLSNQDYQRAEQMLSWNLSGKVLGATVTPNWIDNHRFWYKITTRRGVEYRLIDAQEENKMPAFDHEKLASAISSEMNGEVGPWDLSLQKLAFSDGLDRIGFELNDTAWSCSVSEYQCEQAGKIRRPVENSILSPDGKLAAFTRNDNLWVEYQNTGEQIQLTGSGSEKQSMAKNNHGWWRSETPILVWSPDSKKIATFRLDERGVKNMVLWSAKEGRPEPDIWPYALPGDSEVPMLERVIVDVESRETLWIDVKPSHQRASNCCGLVRGQEWTDIEWSPDVSRLAFVTTSRDYKDVSLYIAHTESGDVDKIFTDRDELFFESNLKSRGVPNWRVLHNSNEFIWFNRSDNWGHLYLYNLETGQLKNQITSGSWNVIDILHVDETNRTITFTAMGREDDRDPYFEHLYRVNFDGSNPELLTPENANHSVLLSPGRDYIVNTYSDFSTPPVTVLRNRDGRKLMTLEEADISALLETGWQTPVPFSAKARDSVTDIYGVMILPSHFDEEKTYPIVNAIYPGPQSGSIGSRSFSTTFRGQAAALAELGFIVVAIDGLGSSPLRSREFHTATHGDMSDNGLPDQIAAMKQLADRYPFIDLKKAGIYGHSGGGFATAAALLTYPEFFKVGVSGAGNHDNRNYTYYWGEKYQGLLNEENGSDNYENQANQLKAENLEGKLLITYGSMDTNVHPSMSQLLIDKLIEHNKDFDMLVMPNRGHGYANEPYAIRRTWDYFVEHLLGKIPPKEYQITR